MISQDAGCTADGAQLVVTHSIVSRELLVRFQGQSLEACNILNQTDLYAGIYHLTELVKHPQNLGTGRVVLLNCFNRPHKLA
jgi:hypothetical protein